MDGQVGQLQDAIFGANPVLTKRLLASISGLRIREVGFDETDPVAYASIQGERGIYGLCAYIDHDRLITVPETAAPLYFSAPLEVVQDLDATLDPRSIRWRRDCMMMLQRRMTQEAHLGHPYWTALFSRVPICQLARPCHVAVLLDSPGRGLVNVAATDGTNFKVIALSTDDAALLAPLPHLEWDGSMDWLLATRGCGGSRYVGVGPAHYRVGMLFSDTGGLLLWSGAATLCEQMATIGADSGAAFQPSEIYRQLTHWQEQLTS